MPGPRRTSFFLVERYAPVADLDVLSSAVARVSLACAHGHTGVRYLHSTYVPTEDTCFCVFEAPSAQRVRAVNDVARFGLDRIVPAIGLDIER
jgi:hypothetical protein